MPPTQNSVASSARVNVAILYVGAASELYLIVAICMYNLNNQMECIMDIMIEKMGFVTCGHILKHTAY